MDVCAESSFRILRADGLVIGYPLPTNLLPNLYRATEGILDGNDFDVIWDFARRSARKMMSFWILRADRRAESIRNSGLVVWNMRASSPGLLRQNGRLLHFCF